ncbi:MAG: hypothetical protein R3304_02340 [Longimicrobiales bacterium]|nr:hypothetical protein [Longimicrobiales bacterium]
MLGRRHETRTWKLAILAVVAATGWLGGCGSASAGREVSFRGDGAPGLTITIRNQRTQDARLWIWIEGRRESLGMVQSTGTETFRTALPRVSRVRLEFDLTLGARCFTRAVSLEPGTRLDVTIPSNLSLMDARCG